jgi:tellurite methyltransferase
MSQNRVLQNQSVAFFDTQFQRQVASRDFALNPFEQATLSHVSGRVLDLGSGLGNLSIEAARRGASVTAVDASSAAIARIKDAAGAERLPIDAQVVDLASSYSIQGDYDTIVAIGLLMFFRRERALALLSDIQRHVVPRGRAIVNVLIEGTTFMGMFEPDNYYLFGRGELEQRFAGWNILLSRQESFEAPGGTQKEFTTLVAEKTG